MDSVNQGASVPAVTEPAEAGHPSGPARYYHEGPTGVVLCSCGQQVPAGNPHRKYCSERCSRRAGKARATLRVSERLQALLKCVDCAGPMELERIHRKGTKPVRCAPCNEAWRSIGRHREKRRALPSWGKPTGVPSQYVAVNPFELPLPVAPSTKGAANELVVAVDLMRRGYDVYRALSPAAACDLVVMRGQLALRVEVRTAARGKNGRAKAPVTPGDRGRFDVMAAVEPNGTVYYKGLPDVS